MRALELRKRARILEAFTAACAGLVVGDPEAVAGDADADRPAAGDGVPYVGIQAILDELIRRHITSDPGFDERARRGFATLAADRRRRRAIVAADGRLNNVLAQQQEQQHQHQHQQPTPDPRAEVWRGIDGVRADVARVLARTLENAELDPAVSRKYRTGELPRTDSEKVLHADMLYGVAEELFLLGALARDIPIRASLLVVGAWQAKHSLSIRDALTLWLDMYLDDTFPWAAGLWHLRLDLVNHKVPPTEIPATIQIVFFPDAAQNYGGDSGIMRLVSAIVSEAARHGLRIKPNDSTAVVAWLLETRAREDQLIAGQLSPAFIARQETPQRPPLPAHGRTVRIPHSPSFTSALSDAEMTDLASVLATSSRVLRNRVSAHRLQGSGTVKATLARWVRRAVDQADLGPGGPTVGALP